MTATLTGFPPIAGSSARILILGSMPSVSSLQQQRYYAHPRNAFWPIMANLFGFSADSDYALRCEILIRHHIALWDCIQCCQRQGSLDQHIQTDSIIPNDFDTFLQHHPHLTHLFFNGHKARQLFQRFIEPQCPSLLARLEKKRLPSTSPAHAALRFEQKLAAWQAVKTALTSPIGQHKGEFHQGLR